MDKIELLLGDAARVRRYATIMCNAHYDLSHTYEQRRILLGLPTIVLSAIVGTAVFRDLEGDLDSPIKIATGLLAILAAILAALQTFLDFPGASARHKKAAIGYESARHELDGLMRMLQVSPPGEGQLEAVLETFAAIEARLTKVAEEAPTVPDRVYEHSARNLKADPALLRPTVAAAKHLPIAGQG